MMVRCPNFQRLRPKVGRTTGSRQVLGRWNPPGQIRQTFLHPEPPTFKLSARRQNHPHPKQGASEFVAARRWPGRPALSLRRSSFEVRTTAGAWSQGQRRVTAPLCRDHHQQRHREGNAIASWSNLRIKADDGGEGIMRRDMHRAKVISSRFGQPSAQFRRWNVHCKSVNGAPQAVGSQFLRYLK